MIDSGSWKDEQEVGTLSPRPPTHIKILAFAKNKTIRMLPP